MTPLTAADPLTHSADLVGDNLAALRGLFPEAFTEGKVDFDVLRQLLGDAVDDRPEKYGLNWHGKRAARQLALTPSAGTLRPRPGDGVEEATTQNLVIEGDNLEVLKLLQKSYSGKVKLIYIDPPYNTGHDFVYPDDFKDSIGNYLTITSQANQTSNPESSGRFHTDWLNMMYPRLKLARNLLTEDGVVVIHIDEHESHSVVMLINEMFGEENHLGTCVWDKRNPKGDSTAIAYQHESLVFFAKSAAHLAEASQPRRKKANASIMLETARNAVMNEESIKSAALVYQRWLSAAVGISGGEAMYSRLDKDGRIYRLVSMAWPNKKQAPPQYHIPLIHLVTNKECPIPERGWRNPPETMERLLTENLIEFGQNESTQPQRRYYLDENQYENVPSVLPFGGSDDALFTAWGIPFDHPKPVKFATDVISFVSKKDDIVLDFFAGSGTTGHAVMAQNAADGGNRRFILVQLPEKLALDNKDQKTAYEFCKSMEKTPNIAELTKERLRRAGAKVKAENPLFAGDMGFRVFYQDYSNLRTWQPDREALGQMVLDAADHVRPDRSDEDVVAELLLKLGLDLCVPVETRTVAGKLVFSVGRGVLLVCLDRDIGRADAEPLALGLVAWHAELAPAGASTVVFRDSGFADDVAKSNLAAILHQHGLSAVRSL